MPETLTVSSPQSRSNKPDLKTELFVAVSEAFPEPGEVSIKALAAGHPKIASRKLKPQYLVRVSGLICDTYEPRMVIQKDDGKDVPVMERKPVKVPYAVCALFPQDGDVAQIPQLIADLKSDAQRVEDGFPK